MYFTGRKAAVVYNVVYLQYVCCASRQMYPRNNQYALVEVKTLLFLALIFFYGSLCRKILLMFEYIGLNYIKCRLVCVVSLAGRWTTPEYWLAVLCQYKMPLPLILADLLDGLTTVLYRLICDVYLFKPSYILHLERALKTIISQMSHLALLIIYFNVPYVISI